MCPIFFDTDFIYGKMCIRESFTKYMTHNQSVLGLEFEIYFKL